MNKYVALVIFVGLVAPVGSAPEVAAVTNANMSGSTPGQGTNALGGPTETYLSSGETVALKSGCRFSIRLQSNPTTGYGWQLARPLDEKIVVLVTNDYIRPDTTLVGAGGHEVWAFKAVGRGQADITLTYVRPWETNQPPAETSVLKIVVN